MDVAVPVVPDTTPAVSSVQRLRGSSAPMTVTATTASTAAPTRTPSACTGTAVTSQMPAAVPARRPASAQDTPGQSVCPASRARMSTGRTAPATSREPGMRAGSSSVTTGAATMTSPSPAPPWTSAPAATAIPATRNTVVTGISESTLPARADTGTVVLLTPARDRGLLPGSPRQRYRPARQPADREFGGQGGQQHHDRDRPASGRGVQEPDDQRARRGHKVARSLGERRQRRGGHRVGRPGHGVVDRQTKPSALPETEQQRPRGGTAQRRIRGARQAARRDDHREGGQPTLIADAVGDHRQQQRGDPVAEVHQREQGARVNGVRSPVPEQRREPGER